VVVDRSLVHHQSSAAAHPRFVRPRYFYVAPDVHRIKRVRMQLSFDNWIGGKVAACVGYLRLVIQYHVPFMSPSFAHTRLRRQDSGVRVKFH
jgi:hypothetical protein